MPACLPGSRCSFWDNISLLSSGVWLLSCGFLTDDGARLSGAWIGSTLGPLMASWAGEGKCGDQEDHLKGKGKLHD